MTLDPTLVEFATAQNFAALTTLAADGQPSTHMMWVDADDDHLIINTEIHRQKFKNITGDPRVCVTVIDAGSPYRYIEARGRVVEIVHGDAARRHIDEVSRRYTGADYAPPITSERVIVKIAVDRIHRNGF
ncbi:MAG: TIGR03618 family F420-dependent PPOX class oxidoreductase [Actinobacteria bacterium]|nr:TIGR03618 family F420-dependent PPOX class oxidoreductase [Actinomycetota bacterium]